MAKGKGGRDPDIDALSKDVAERFDEVPWRLFNSSDLAASGETRFEVSRIQVDLMKVAAVDGRRAARIWDEHVPTFVPRPADLPEAERTPDPVNSMAPGRRRRRSVVEPFLDPSIPLGDNANAVRREESQSEAARPASGVPDKGADNRDDPNLERARALLDGLNKRYLKADDKYHFRDRDGEVAFEVRDKKLITEHHAPTVVTGMIDLAEARGWSSIKLTGTKEFRREAWLQASLRAVEVGGYQPDALDRTRLDELKAVRSERAPENAIVRDREPKQTFRDGFEPLIEDGAGEARIPLTQAQDQFLRAMEATMRHRGDAPTAIAKARQLANERLTSERVHVGVLTEAGTAPFQDRPGERASHYVTLQQDDGRKTKVWGVDLPRALAESGAEPGQLVAVAFKARQSVNVDVPVKDGEGRTVRVKQQTVDRNTWEVIPFDRLREDAKARTFEAVRRQEQPAALKVFDRNTPSRSPKAEPGRSEGRERERNI